MQMMQYLFHPKIKESIYFERDNDTLGLGNKLSSWKLIENTKDGNVPLFVLIIFYNESVGTDNVICGNTKFVPVESAL